jgi:hypothetical protein
MLHCPFFILEPLPRRIPHVAGFFLRRGNDGEAALTYLRRELF